MSVFDELIIIILHSLLYTGGTDSAAEPVQDQPEGAGRLSAVSALVSRGKLSRRHSPSGES